MCNKEISKETYLRAIDQYNEVRKECLNRWSKTNLLDDISPEYQGEMALMMENQSLMNEREHEPVPISLMKEVFSNFLGFELVNVQVMLGPTCACFARMPDEDYNIERIMAKARILSQKCSDDINYEIIRDLRSNAATDILCEWKSDLWSTVEDMREEVQAKCGVKPNWILAGSEVINELKKDVRIKLVEYKKFPDNEILLGYKDKYVSGYSFMPYIPFTKSNSGDLLFRYGKSFHSRCSLMYGRLKKLIS
jgi:hypothetical protein